MKDYTIIYKTNDFYEVYKTKRRQIACYVCFTLLMLIIGVVLYAFIENDVLYFVSALLTTLLFITMSLYMFLVRFPKTNWYYNLFVTLDEGHKSTTPLKFISIEENDDKTKKVLFEKLDSEETVELLMLNYVNIDFQQQTYFISHVGKYLYGFKEYEE